MEKSTEKPYKAKRSSLNDFAKLLNQWIANKETGNISFKGEIIIGSTVIPVNTRINLFEGGISSLNITQSIYARNK